MVVLDCPERNPTTAHSSMLSAGSDNTLHRISTEGRMGVGSLNNMKGSFKGFYELGC